MKTKFFLALVATLSLSNTGFAANANGDELIADNQSCELASACNMENVCLLDNSAMGVVKNTVGLHYGSLSTKKLVVEIVRAEVSPEKLKMLKKRLQISIESNGNDAGEHGFQLLEGRRVGSTLEFALEKHVSSFYIASVRIENRHERERIGEAVRAIFGSRAVALISGVGRN